MEYINNHKYLGRRFAIAPMMDWTDRHDRFFLRQITRRARLFTEMVTAAAVLRGDRERLLGFDGAEHPVVLQLGGSDPALMAEAASIGEAFGYDEININVGCPSDRVQDGRFGACLMAEPELVASCVEAMKRSTRRPVTVKHRVGIDQRDSFEDLVRFVETIAAAGCDTFYVHARKAWLNGLSPKENREIPPLRYEVVHQLRDQFPSLGFVINGGIRSIGEAKALLARLDGVMVGREAYQNPWMLAEVDRRIFGEAGPEPDRRKVVEAMARYADRMAAERGTPVKSIARHMLGLFQGLPGARAWRRYLSEHAHRPGATGDVLLDALDTVERGSQRRAAA